MIHKLCAVVNRFFTIILIVLMLADPVFSLEFNEAMDRLSTDPAGTVEGFDDEFNDINDYYKAVGTYYRDNNINIYYSLGWRYTRLTPRMDGIRVKSVSASSRFKDELNNEGYLSWFDDYTDGIITGAKIKERDSDRHKINKLARYIARVYTYDDIGIEAEYNKNAESFMDVIRNCNISDCMTDAMLFQACCDKLGIPCKYVEGEQDGLHAWNIVEINGREYEVDVAFVRGRVFKFRYILFHSGRKIYYTIG